jgi:hypothetical protein
MQHVTLHVSPTATLFTSDTRNPVNAATITAVRPGSGKRLSIASISFREYASVSRVGIPRGMREARPGSR